MVTLLPFDMDTSCPLRLVSSFYLIGGSASTDFRFEVKVARSLDGQTLYPSSAAAPTSPPATSLERSVEFIIYTVQAADIDSQKQGFVDVDISDFVANEDNAGIGEVIWISVERDTGNGSDTYTGDVTLIQLTPYYTQWCNGGHIAGQ